MSSVDEDDPFELFIASTNIRYSYYHETHKILGNTYGMCVLQDFEALTPNLLARTVETVEGGGAIVLLVNSVSSLKQLYTLTMDVHSRYRTEAHQDVVNRFNERFILSLASNHSAIFLNDALNILPISSHVKALKKASTAALVSDREKELVELKAGLQDTQPIGALVNCARLEERHLARYQEEDRQVVEMAREAQHLLPPKPRPRTYWRLSCRPGLREQVKRELEDRKSVV